MLKTKSYDLDIQKMAEATPTKQPQMLIDFGFGLNNAFSWWESNNPVKMKFEWDGGKSEAVANGEQVLDVFIGLITKYGWQDMKGILHAEFTWDDLK